MPMNASFGRSERGTGQLQAREPGLPGLTQAELYQENGHDQ